MAEGGSEPTTSTILVVEDDPNVASAVSRLVRSEGITPLNAKTLAAARKSLGDGMRGMILDIALPDGNGLELIPEARARVPDLPIIVMTGADASEVANKIHLLNAIYVCKPDVHANLLAFVRSCVANSGNEVSRVIDELEGARSLTPAERRLVEVAIITSAREAVAELLDVSVNTVKTQAARLLDKMGAKTLGELSAPLRARVLRSDPTVLNALVRLGDRRRRR